MRAVLNLITKLSVVGAGDVRTAYAKGDSQASAAAHKHKHQHSHHEHHNPSAEYLADFVLGGIDGIITTFAVVAGVVGANLSSGVIIILGLANLLADGLSMAIGNYLGAKSEADYYSKERVREEWEIKHVPEHEREEIRDIYRAKGFEGELLDRVVEHITSNPQLWIDTMMRDELNIIEDRKNPVLVGLVTLLAFIGFGSIPLIVYFYAYLQSVPASDSFFVWCLISTGLALFGVGAARSKFTLQSWIRSGLEILLLGGAAGTVAYYVGVALKGLT